jgi:hypothetical protein
MMPYSHTVKEKHMNLKNTLNDFTQVLIALNLDPEGGPELVGEAKLFTKRVLALSVRWGALTFIQREAETGVCQAEPLTGLANTHLRDEDVKKFVGLNLCCQINAMILASKKHPAAKAGKALSKKRPATDDPGGAEPASMEPQPGEMNTEAATEPIYGAAPHVVREDEGEEEDDEDEVEGADVGAAAAPPPKRKKREPKAKKVKDPSGRARGGKRTNRGRGGATNDG